MKRSQPGLRGHPVQRLLGERSSWYVLEIVRKAGHEGRCEKEAGPPGRPRGYSRGLVEWKEVRRGSM